MGMIKATLQYRCCHLLLVHVPIEEEAVRATAGRLYVEHGSGSPVM